MNAAIFEVAIVGVDIQSHLVNVAVFKVAHDGVAAKVALAVGTMTGERAIVPARPLMPRLSRHIVNPSGVGQRETSARKRHGLLAGMCTQWRLKCCRIGQLRIQLRG